jgi:hypothetical protein
MEKEKLTRNEVVINHLMDGDPMTSQDIADKVSGNGASMDVREVSTIMNKLNKTNLGHFINKKRKGRAFEYKIVDEAAKNLTPEEAYGLSLKIGKDRYPLEQALEDHPDLSKHVKKARKKKAAPAKTREKAPAKAKKTESASEETVQIESGMDAAAVEDILKGLLKAIAGDKELNVNVDVTVRFEQ